MRTIDRPRAERRAEEFASQLIAEGWAAEHAQARAAAAYGLQRDCRAPEPSFTPSIRRAWLEHAAGSRPGTDADPTDRSAA